MPLKLGPLARIYNSKLGMLSAGYCRSRRERLGGGEDDEEEDDGDGGALRWSSWQQMSTTERI